MSNAGVLSPVVGIEEVAEIIRRRLTDLGRSQGWLGAEVAAVLGRDQPFVQSAVSQWMLGITTMEPPIVFAMERALGLRPGDLSRLLGYLPVQARAEPAGVEAAIQADPHLSDNLKRALVAAYREMRG